MNRAKTHKTAGTRHPRAHPIDAHEYHHSINFELLGVDRAYLNAMHEGYRFHENWPAGLLVHFVYWIDGGARGAGLWSDEHEERKYFDDVVLREMTQSINQLGPPDPGTSAGDFGFRRRHIHRLLLAEECEAFANIGIDRDGSAIHALGGDPVATVFELGEIDAHDHIDLLDALGYHEWLPYGMLLDLLEEADGALIETQFWSSAQAARTELTRRYLPAVGHELGHTPELEFFVINRISFSEAELRAALH